MEALLAIGLAILIYVVLNRLFRDAPAWPFILIGLVCCPLLTIGLLALGLAIIALPVLIIIGIIILIAMAI
jgi:hypothetical protein